MEFLSAGEQHGSCLTAIISDVPAGMTLEAASINGDLDRFNATVVPYNPSKDHVELLSGVRFGCTTGAPIALRIENIGWRAWRETMNVEGPRPRSLEVQSVPRPGSADLQALMKYDCEDCNDIAERTSSRTGAALVAAGSVAKELLASLGVEVYSYVAGIGAVAMNEADPALQATDHHALDIEFDQLRCPDATASARMVKALEAARDAGEGLGGSFRVVATGVIPGLGDPLNGNGGLASDLAAAVFAVPGVCGMQLGNGAAASVAAATAAHDGIGHSMQAGFTRAGNNAGGVEQGMTNGMPLVLTAQVLPPIDVAAPQASISTATLQPASSTAASAEVCRVPSAAVLAEARVALVLANAYTAKFGGDTITDIQTAVAAYQRRCSIAAR